MRYSTALGLCLLPLASVPVAQSVLDVNGEPDPAYPGFHAWFDAQGGVNGAGQPASGAAVGMAVGRCGLPGGARRATRAPTVARRPPTNI